MQFKKCADSPRFSSTSRSTSRSTHASQAGIVDIHCGKSSSRSQTRFQRSKLVRLMVISGCMKAASDSPKRHSSNGLNKWLGLPHLDRKPQSKRFASMWPREKFVLVSRQAVSIPESPSVQRVQRLDNNKQSGQLAMDYRKQLTASPGLSLFILA
jgi:ABC-type molybdenum transport system ATPase subunit/photorepair protein PhrA